MMDALLGWSTRRCRQGRGARTISACGRTLRGGRGIWLMLSILLLCPARGVGASEASLCQAEQTIESLVAAIRQRHDAIADRQDELDSLYERAAAGHWISRTWHLRFYLLAWVWHQLDTANDYWRIGSMESTLLIAYSKLGAARQSVGRRAVSQAEQRTCQLLAGSSASGAVSPDS